jgi:hypothetical protein
MPASTAWRASSVERRFFEPGGRPAPGLGPPRPWPLVGPKKRMTRSRLPDRTRRVVTNTRRLPAPLACATAPRRWDTFRLIASLAGNTRLCTPLYRSLLLAIERRRRQLGWPSSYLDDRAGTQDGYFQKILHADAPSGRCARWETLQLVVDALFPDGINLLASNNPAQLPRFVVGEAPGLSEELSPGHREA